MTRDDTLLDELLRLAAAAGITPDVAHDPAGALRGWSGASLVLVGLDLLDAMARLRPERRAGVHVVGWAPCGADAFRLALEAGSESVAELPAAGAWLTDVLSDLGDRGTQGLTLGVIGGSGGAGATTLACALGQVAGASGPCVVVDLDPLGPGVDRMLGLESTPGVRWDALGHTSGRLGSRALREALPRRGALGVLTWAGRGDPLDPAAVREALAAARRGHETVVVDLPRAGDPLVEEVVSRCDQLLVVISPTVVGTASAARLLARLPDVSRTRLVLRGPGVDADEVAALTGVPVAAVMRDQRRIAESIDLGLGPARSLRVPLARAAAELLHGAALRPVAA